LLSLLASGGGTFTSIGHAGEFLDIEALREDKTWRVAPERALLVLHLLLKGAQHAESIEQLKGLVAKAGGSITSSYRYKNRP